MSRQVIARPTTSTMTFISALSWSIASGKRLTKFLDKSATKANQSTSISAETTAAGKALFYSKLAGCLSREACSKTEFTSSTAKRWRRNISLIFRLTYWRTLKSATSLPCSPSTNTPTPTLCSWSTTFTSSSPAPMGGTISSSTGSLTKR